MTDVIDADNGDNNETFRKYEVHEAIIFSIELSPRMFEKVEDLDNKIQLIEILQSLQTLMSQLVIVRPGTAIGCYLYYSGRDDAKNGLYELFPLKDINAKHMKILSDLLEDLETGRLDILEYFKYNVNKVVSLEHVFTTMQEKFLEEVPGQKQSTFRRIFLFTDIDTPEESNSNEVKKRLRRIVDDMNDQFINFVPFFIGDKNKPFNNSFYSDILKLGAKTDANETEYDGPNTTPIAASYIKSRILRRKEIKRTLFQCPLILNESKKFIMGLRGYTIINIEKPGTRYKLVYEQEEIRKEAFSRRKLLNPLTGEEVKLEDTCKVHTISDLNIDISDKDILTFKEESREFNPFLKTIGFRSQDKCIKYFNNIEKATFVVPDESQFEGSNRTMASLYRTMRSKNSCMIIWGKLKVNSNPALYILSPSSEMDRNEGFYLYRVPYLDEARKIPNFTSYDNIENNTEYKNLIKITENIMGYFNLKNGYVPSEYRNPGLQKHYKLLHDYLLQIENNQYEDTDEGKVQKYLDEDDTLKKVSHIRKNINASKSSSNEETQKLQKYIEVWNNYYKKIEDEDALVTDKSSTSSIKKFKMELNL